MAHKKVSATKDLFHMTSEELCAARERKLRRQIELCYNYSNASRRFPLYIVREKLER